MTDNALDKIKTILDRLGPNMWLELDEVSFARVFGRGFGADESAAAFAEQKARR